MSPDNRTLRSRWSDFLDSLRTQVSAACAVGLPAEDAYERVEPGPSQAGNDGLQTQRPGAPASAARSRDDAPGYMTRNGLGSLEVGAFRDRTGE